MFAAIVWGCVLFAADIETNISLVNTTGKSGKIHVAIFDTSAGFKKKDAMKRQTLPAGTSNMSISLPAGEYVVSAYIDVNGNGKADASLIGIPKEPVGISNYDGKSIPGNFDRHKVVVGEGKDRITVRLVEIMAGKEE